MIQSPISALILASTSPYRKSLLERLGLPFDTVSPDVDETPEDEETPESLALRLAVAKSTAISNKYKDSAVIGSDQVATFDGHILGKPGTSDAAFRQLRLMSGHDCYFHTALSVQQVSTGFSESVLVSTRVGFRELSDQEIQRYLEKEFALDCAGAFKSEGLGISLTRYMTTDDATALIGLPLIATARLLRACGFDLP